MHIGATRRSKSTHPAANWVKWPTRPRSLSSAIESIDFIVRDRGREGCSWHDYTAKRTYNSEPMVSVGKGEQFAHS